MINNPPNLLCSCECNRVNLCQTYTCCPSYRTNCNEKFQIRKCFKKHNNDNTNIFYIFCDRNLLNGKNFNTYPCQILCKGNNVDFSFSKENSTKSSDGESKFIRKSINEINCENENESKYLAVSINGRAKKSSSSSKENPLGINDKETNLFPKNAKITEQNNPLYKACVDSTKPAITPLNLNSHVCETAAISQDNFEDTIVHSETLTNKEVDDKYDMANSKFAFEPSISLSKKGKVDRETQENMKYKSGISMVSVSTNLLTNYYDFEGTLRENNSDNDKLSPKIDATPDKTSDFSSLLNSLKSEKNNAAFQTKQMNNLIKPENISVETKLLMNPLTTNKKFASLKTPKQDNVTVANKQEETTASYASETTSYCTGMSCDSCDVTLKMDKIVQNYTIQSNFFYNPLSLDIILPIIFTSLIMPPDLLIKKSLQTGFKSVVWGDLFPMKDILKEIDLNPKYHKSTSTSKKCHTIRNSDEENKVMESEILQMFENYPTNWTNYKSIKWTQGHSNDSTAEDIDTLLQYEYKSKKKYNNIDQFLKLSTLQPSETSQFSSSGDFSSTFTEIDREINLLKYKKIKQNFVKYLKKKNPESFISYSLGNNLPSTNSLRQSYKTYDSECSDWKKLDQESKRHNNNDMFKKVSKKSLKMNRTVQDLANKFDSMSCLSNQEFRSIYNKISEPVKEKLNYFKSSSRLYPPLLIDEINTRIFDEQTNRSRHVSQESKRSNWFDESINQKEKFKRYTSSNMKHNKLSDNTNFSKEFLNCPLVTDHFPKYSNRMKDSNILSQKEKSIMLCKSLMSRVENQDRELSEKLSKLFDDRSNKIYNTKKKSKRNESLRHCWLMDQKIFPFKFHAVNLNLESNLSNNVSNSKFKYFGQQFPVREKISNSINRLGKVCESNLKFTPLNRLNLSYATIEDNFNDVEYYNLLNDRNKYNFQEKLKHISYEDCRDMFEKLFASDDAELEDEWSLNPELELPIFDTKSNGDKISEPRNNIYNLMKDELLANESYSNIKTTELAETPLIKKYEPLQSSKLKTGSMDLIIYGEMVDNIFENQSFIIRPKIVRTVSRIKPKITTKKLRESKTVKQKISSLISDKSFKHAAHYFKNNSKSPIPTKRQLNYHKKLDFSAYLYDRQISAYICPEKPKTTYSRNYDKTNRRK